MTVATTTPLSTTSPSLLLRDREVAELLALDRRRHSPQPVRIGRAARWRRADIEAAVERLAAEQFAP